MIADSVTGANYLHPNLGRGKRAEFAFFKSPPGGHFAARHTNPLGDASASEMHHRAAIGACPNWEGISKMSRLAMNVCMISASAAISALSRTCAGVRFGALMGYRFCTGGTDFSYRNEPQVRFEATEATLVT